MNFAGADHPSSKSFAIIIIELMRLLFLHAHRETTRFFEFWDDGHAQPHTSRFTYRRAAFFNTLKSKTGLMVAKAAALLHACVPHFHIPVT